MDTSALRCIDRSGVGVEFFLYFEDGVVCRFFCFGADDAEFGQRKG